MGSRGLFAGRRWLLGAAVAALLVAILAWGSAGALGASSSPAATAGSTTDSSANILKLGYLSGPDNLNPWQGSNVAAFECWHLTWDLLYTYDAKTGDSKPELAIEAPQYSADGLTVTIKLRQGVKWSDGQPFTAADVVWTYDAIINPKTTAAAGTYSAYLVDLAGNGLKSVKALDDYTVQLNYNQYRPNIGKLWIPILPAHVWSKLDFTKANLQVPKPFVGTGPFQVYYEDDSIVKLKVNPYYWGETPKVSEVHFKTYTNSSAMITDFENNDLALIDGLQPQEFDGLKGKAGIKAASYPTKTWDYLGFNVYDTRVGATQGYGNVNLSKGNPVLLDVKFRQALNWAIDKDKLVTLAYGGYAVAGSSIMPPKVWPVGLDYHYDPAATTGAINYTYDPEKAKAALEAAGYKDVNGDGLRETKDGKPLSLRLATREESKPSQVQGDLIRDWFIAVGIKVKTQVYTYDSLSAATWLNYDAASNWTPDFDMYMWDWVGYEDPGDTLVCFTESQIYWWNDTGWINPAFDKAYALSENEQDPAKRVPLVQAAERILYEQSPEIVTVYPLNLQAYHEDNWTGWVPQNSDQQGTNGAVALSNNNMDSYLYVHPGSADSKGTSTMWLLYVGIGVVVIVAVVIFLVKRGSGKEVDEAA